MFVERGGHKIASLLFLVNGASMPTDIALIATRDLEHEGRPVARGEVFAAPPVTASIYVRRHQARLAPRGTEVPRIASRRRYRRRDLRAED